MDELGPYAQGGGGGEGKVGLGQRFSTEGHFAPPDLPPQEGNWQCLETFLFVVTQAGCSWHLVGWRPGMLPTSYSA